MILAFLALGCSQPGDSEAADTEVVDTEITGTTDDTDTTIDYSITVEVRGEGEPGLTLAAVLCRIADDGMVEPIREYQSVDASTLPVELTFEPPSGPDDIVDLGDGYSTGSLVFWVLYRDENHDGVRNDDEPIAGTSAQVLTWLEHGQQFSRIWLGLELGLLDYGIDIFDAFDGFDVTTFDPHDTITFGGTTSFSASGRDPDGLAMVTLDEIDGIALVPNRPYDEPWAGDPWSITLDAPDDDGRLLDPGLGVLLGIEEPIAYVDADHDGVLSLDDPALGWTCHGDVPVSLLYEPPFLTMYEALTGLALGLQPGWNVAETPTRDDYPTPLTDADAHGLTLSDVDCPRGQPQ